MNKRSSKNVTGFGAAADPDGDKNFPKVFDALLDEIRFESEAESILPKNVEKTRNAILTFTDSMKWHFGQLHFEAVLEEKTGKHALRGNQKTPNWYHEVRNMLMLFSLVRTGVVPMEAITKCGGLETLFCMAKRHDSPEDHAVGKAEMLGPMTARINDLLKRSIITPEKVLSLEQAANQITEGAYILSRLELTPGPDGKRAKRYGGNEQAYYDAMREHIWVLLTKYPDKIEGATTRYGVPEFTWEKNLDYANKNFRIFDGHPFDKEARAFHQGLRDIFRVLDNNLGIGLAALRTYAQYMDPSADLSTIRRIPVRKYLSGAPEKERATRGLGLLPGAWHPIILMQEGLENEVTKEREMGLPPRSATILHKAIYPELTAYPRPYNYSVPKGGSHFTMVAPNSPLSEFGLNRGSS